MTKGKKKRRLYIMNHIYSKSLFISKFPMDILAAEALLCTYNGIDEKEYSWKKVIVLSSNPDVCSKILCCCKG